MKKNNLLLILLILLFSCSESNKDSFPSNANLISDSLFVDIDEAENLAFMIGMPNARTKSVNGRDFAKTVKEKLVVPDKAGENAFYIINYQEGGFVILAADKRVDPILALSDEGSIPLDSYEHPSGLLEWFAELQEEITDIRTDETKQDLPIRKSWKLEEPQRISTFLIPGLGDELTDIVECPVEETKAGPLLKTKWGQRGGFNDFCPVMNCSSQGGRALAGCVATATAQIMRYHEYPKTYNWGVMHNEFGGNETSRLIADIGRAIGMDYGCEGSSAKSDKVPNVMKNTFKYTYSSTSDFNITTVKHQIINGLPVILAGGRKSGWWIFASYKDGHAWVADGYSYHVSWDFPDCNQGHSYEYLHMNWGWNGTYDGWYRSTDWTISADNSSYNYQKKMTTIKP